MEKYIQTKMECETKMAGLVCEECGEVLDAIETVDNSRNPTFWRGCLKCSRFRSGVYPHQYKICDELSIDGVLPIRDKASLSMLISRLEKHIGGSEWKKQ